MTVFSASLLPTAVCLPAFQGLEGRKNLARGASHGNGANDNKVFSLSRGERVSRPGVTGEGALTDVDD